MNKVVSYVSLIAAFTLAIPTVAQSEQASQFKDWYQVNSKSHAQKTLSSRVSIGHSSRVAIDELSQLLLLTDEGVIASLPLPNGQLVDFFITPSQVVAQQLADSYPNIKTFSGYQLDAPENTGRFDITPQGFHGMFNSGQKIVFIDPKYQGDNSHYISYFREDASHLISDTLVRKLPPKKFKHSSTAVDYLNKAAKNQHQVALRTYRLAISATGEFTKFHGGDKTSALAALVTMVNRLNDVYQRDLAIKLELVANNDAIIYTDPASDPFNNDDNDGEINTGIIDKAIGSNNYDIGHVVNTAGGGLAGFGVVCSTNAKGDGVTGDSNPVGDAFHIDYVAHEIGHQFGADHTFNGMDASCEGNRAEQSAFEPGSASTIMGYAGICGSQNLQNNSDPFFHSHSIDQISDFVTKGEGNSCGSVDHLANVAPKVNAGHDYTIPARTPFTLTGSASDENSLDKLSYSWQQYDLGPSSKNSLEQTDDGKRPLFRTWSPVAEPTRTFPRLSDILADTTTLGESYPTTTREMNFRLLVRDDKGGVARDSMKVQVIDGSEAFAVTSPSQGTLWTGQHQVVTWDLAGTNKAPISCQSVTIDLSSDGGLTFDKTIASAVANTGRAEITLPAVNSSKSRVRVSCVDNIFFAISKGDFSVNASQSSGNIEITGQQSITLDEDSSIELTPSMFTYSGPAADKMIIVAGDNYQVEGAKLIPQANFNGQLAVPVKASLASEISQEFMATITVFPVNDAPVAVDDSYSVTQGSENNTLDVISNDSDLDKDDVLTIKSIDYQGSANISISDNKISYTPSSQFSGSESFSYTLADSANSQTTAKVTVTVAPTLANQAQTSDKGSGSSGGSVYWLLAIMGLMVVRANKVH